MTASRGAPQQCARSTPTHRLPQQAPSRVHALVLISRLHKPALRALALARSIRPDALSALTLNLEDDETRRLRREWEDRKIPVPLTILEAPYRDPHRPLLTYVKRLHATNPQTVIMVFIPEYVVTKWWQQLLHNQSALRFKARLLFTREWSSLMCPTTSASAARAGWVSAAGRPRHPRHRRRRATQPTSAT